jgi:DNA-binding CsgD family transcriptional regulator
VESGPGDGWFVVRPFVVADTPLDPAVTLGCVLLLCVIFVIEVLTPNAVVAAFAVLPLAVGMWLVSGRFAMVILAATALLFIAASVIEPANRLTLMLVATPILAVGVIIRFYAARVPLMPVASTAPHNGSREPLTALTRRELEVARLAASAYTAAEIGHQLHIGERTVESHLASAYLKLGITSRSELIRMAERLH